MVFNGAFFFLGFLSCHIFTWDGEHLAWVMAFTGYLLAGGIYCVG